MLVVELKTTLDNAAKGTASVNYQSDALGAQGPKHCTMERERPDASCKDGHVLDGIGPVSYTHLRAHET